ncbi:chemotaxis protein CheW [Deferribacteres bacterium DY0037]
MSDNTLETESIYVSFGVGAETYGIGIEDVRQIIRVPKITRVPKMPDYVLGMTNLRGEVLPLVDLSMRLGYKHPCVHGEDTRVIVVDKQGILTGLIVESVNEVKSTEMHDIDKFPDILNAGVDKKYISGILKVGKGEDVSIIQLINTDEIIDIDSAGKYLEQNSALIKKEKKEDVVAGAIDEKRFISFNIKEQEYAIEIHKINEIIWMPEVTSVPGLPSYVLGIFSLRGEVIPLLSLHSRFGMTLNRDDETTRVVIVDIGNVMVAFAADKVNAVVSVDESLIELPPKVYEDQEGSEVSAVLKLEDGKRLVMALEPENLVDDAELEALKSVAEQSKGGTHMNYDVTNTADEEKQIVTFQIENEHYGIYIQKVQEINRYTNVTKIPKTPKFVEGIINLRGEVIPLIDLRSRFELETKPRDEFTRVIIINLQNMKVGFVVDWVDEVLRIRQEDIDPVPPVLGVAVNSEFIEGVINFDKNEKMILLLDVEELFSRAEIKKLENLQEG